MKGNRVLVLSGLIALTLLAAFTCAAQAAYPLPADLNISKNATDLVTGEKIFEINPGFIFKYKIDVTNNDPNNIAPDVMVTDKLPYDVVFKEINVPSDPIPDYRIDRSGDLIYIHFDTINPKETKTIEITVQAPAESPTTLYNIANVRYSNDPNPNNNLANATIYVPEVGYDQTVAAKSFEDLLHNQSQLLFQFEDLLHTIPANASENYTFLASFEQLLRAQANLTSSFEDLLHNQDGSDWNPTYTQENKTYLLKSYERMLYDEAFLFASFDMKLNDSWVSFCGQTAEGHTLDMQTEFIASFEDLLKRQTTLYKSFNLLLNTLGADHDTMAGFLDDYETLLRVESNLIMNFSNLLKMEYEGTGPCGPDHHPDTFCTLPTIEVTRTPILEGGQKFEISITNNDDTQTLIISKLIGTGGISPAPDDVEYHLNGNAAMLWNLQSSPSHLVTYVGTIAPIAPGGTETFNLDYLTITGTDITIPTELEYDFGAITNCETVWNNQTQEIYSLNSPHPHQ